MSNPFESPQDPDSAVPGGRQTLRLKRVGVLSLGVFSGVCGILMGLIVGFFGLILAVSGIGANSGNVGSTFGMGASLLFIAPILYGIGGFLGGLIYAAIYNLVAGLSGGIELQFGRD